MTVDTIRFEGLSITVSDVAPSVVFYRARPCSWSSMAYFQQVGVKDRGLLFRSQYPLSRYFVDSGNEPAGQRKGAAKPAGEHRAQAFLSPRQTACQQRRLPSGQRVHARLGTSNTITSGINKVPT